MHSTMTIEDDVEPTTAERLLALALEDATDEIQCDVTVRTAEPASRNPTTEIEPVPDARNV